MWLSHQVLSLSWVIHHFEIRKRTSLQAILATLVRAPGVLIGEFVRQNTDGVKFLTWFLLYLEGFKPSEYRIAMISERFLEIFMQVTIQAIVSSSSQNTKVKSDLKQIKQFNLSGSMYLYSEKLSKLQLYMYIEKPYMQFRGELVIRR